MAKIVTQKTYSLRLKVEFLQQRKFIDHPSYKKNYQVFLTYKRAYPMSYRWMATFHLHAAILKVYIKNLISKAKVLIPCIMQALY